MSEIDALKAENIALDMANRAMRSSLKIISEREDFGNPVAKSMRHEASEGLRVSDEFMQRVT